MTIRRVLIILVCGVCVWTSPGCDARKTSERPSDADGESSFRRSAKTPDISARPREPIARFSKRVEWIGAGRWLKADTHVHTRYSDGAHSVAEVVDKAAEFGCDVVAITDHSDHETQSASPEYLSDIRAARRSHPEMVILAGLEWNVPPFEGREHVTVLVGDDPRSESELFEFKERFDDRRREERDAALADEGLRWLADRASVGGAKPVLIHNHPSRKLETSMAIVRIFERWRSVNDLMIGFSAAPGHQRSNPRGSYRHHEKLIDGWDPAAARIGDAWDTLLGKGLDVFAARAPSDFHTADPRGAHDPWPGEFSETWIYAPDKSAAGVLKALRAGTFFAAHGHIVREVEFTAAAAGLPRPAWAGETVELPLGTMVTVRVGFVLPERDAEGRPGRIDEVDIITVTTKGARVLFNRKPKPEGDHKAAVVEALQVPVGGVVLRARGRRRVANGPDLLFYTNPIRINVARSASEHE